MGAVKSALFDKLEEMQMTYEEFANQYQYENRLDAARAAIALLWGTAWDESNASHLANAVNKLTEFAGEDAMHEVGDELDLMHLPDGVSLDFVEAGVEALRRAFNQNDAPQGRKYWNEVIRHARISAEVSHG